MDGVDLRIARLAERQHSLATYGQLVEAGLTHREIEYRVEQRRLAAVHRGVYRLPGVRPYFEQRVMAACLATGGAASHRSAAALFHLRGFDPRSQPIEITVKGRRAPRLRGVTTHTANRLLRTTIGVIPVTMPAQMLLGVAEVAPKLAEGAVNDVLVRRISTLPGLVRYVQEHGRSGRAGVGELGALLEVFIRGEQPTESWLEDRVLDCLREQGLPEPERQFWLRLPGGRRVRFDFVFHDQRHLLEADGRLWHTSPAQRRRDAEKDQAAAVLGWTVERVTWLDLQEKPSELFKPLR